MTVAPAARAFAATCFAFSNMLVDSMTLFDRAVERAAVGGEVVLELDQDDGRVRRIGRHGVTPSLDGCFQGRTVP